MARISLDPPRTLLNRISEWYSRRTYGAVLDPVRALAHNRKVMLTDARMEMSLAKWNTLDARLKLLAVMAGSHVIGCSWCTDFGYWEARNEGIPSAKLHAVPVWRERRTEFTELELDVLEYAEAMTETRPTVTDELTARLIERLGEPEFVELTAIVAVENLRSRMNSAFGLTGQGFSDRCAVPSRA
ncbi:carboxymuconolactone decarboxylase [Streptomyces sp. MUSC 14]|uniref:carboxymuconolactone decarboxylase family protein n=1 Tax=Streptomyces sp. MUSC 14 TaxID=1354889 RepID=UPI0008F5F50E|nr:carboxymuconolactone decarboxylase family protein [Streptomyces sp. MUSC 14]OIK00902.1 carboxymuconolactone decarboxylase [Streptomyces sp. MUSC 14]